MADHLRLRPTPEQYREFGDYLCRAHSWYKHLPLMAGRRFVVFVAPDAGIGRLVAVLHGTSPEAATGYSLVAPAEGPEFTDQHPRLHYGWKTTAEYRRRFGYLDYMSRPDPEGSYVRDAGPPVQLPIDVEERCGFVLYPYVSGEFAEAISWNVHEEALQQLQAGACHLARWRVLELASLTNAHRAAWSALDDSEREWVAACNSDAAKSTRGSASAAFRKYLDFEERIEEVSVSLQTQEAEKIRQALAALDHWLVRGQ